MKKLFLILPLLAVCMCSCAHSKKENAVPENTKAVTTPVLELPVQYAAILSPENIQSDIIKVKNGEAMDITGTKGTKIHIPADAFEDEAGNAPVGEISFELKEIYSASDMVLGNFTTMSGDKVLQSGGMLYVNAVNGSKKLRLKKGKKLDISMPIKNSLGIMQLFEGVKDSLGSLDWKLTETQIKESGKKKNNNLPQEEELMNWPEVNPNDDSFNLLKPEKSKSDDIIVEVDIHDKFYPELTQFENMQFKVLDKDEYDPADLKKEWYGVKLINTDDYGVYIIKLQGNGFTKSLTVKPVFKGKDYDVALKKYNAEFDAFKARQKQEEEESAARMKKFLEEQKQLREAQAKEYEKSDYARYYVFSATNMGYINCDRFMNNANTLATLFLLSVKEQFTDIKVTVLLKDYNSCLPLNITDNMKKMGQKIELPKDAKALLIATAYKDGKPCYSITELTLQPKNELVFDLKQGSFEELKKELDKRI